MGSSKGKGERRTWNLLLVLGCLGRGSVDTDNQGVITLEGFKSQLFLGLNLLFLKLLDLTGKDLGGINGRVNAGGLDGNDNMTRVLEEVMGIDTDDTSLIGLSDISENDIDHPDEHAVLVGMTGIFDDGDDIGALLGHVDQITTRSVGELHGVDAALWAHNIGHMGHRGSRGTSKVQDLLARGNVDIVHTTEDTGGDLGTEGIPHTVLNLVSISSLNRDALLAVHSLTGHEVLGDEEILLTPGNEDT